MPSSLAHALAERAGEGDAVLHRRAFERNERHDVRRAHARMLARVRREIDAVARDGDAGERGVDRVLDRRDEGDHRAVVRLVGRHVEHDDAVDRGDRVANRLDDVSDRRPSENSERIRRASWHEGQSVGVRRSGVGQQWSRASACIAGLPASSEPYVERHVRVAAHRRHHAARLAHEQHARREVPRRERQLPERIEAAARDVREIERRGPRRAACPPCAAHDGGEVAQIQIERIVVAEGKARADQRARWIVDASTRESAAPLRRAPPPRVAVNQLARRRRRARRPP